MVYASHVDWHSQNVKQTKGDILFQGEWHQTETNYDIVYSSFVPSPDMCFSVPVKVETDERKKRVFEEKRIRVIERT